MSDFDDKGIRIPLWWGLVAILIAGLVAGPIFYAQQFDVKKDDAPEQAQAKPLEAVPPEQEPEAVPAPQKAEAVPPMKEAEASKPAETPPSATGEAKPEPSFAAEDAKEQPKPEASNQTASPKEGAEPAVTEPEAATHHNASVKEEAPAPKAEAVPAEKSAAVEKTAEPAAAKPAASETVQAPASPVVANAGSEAKPESPKPAEELKKPVALPKGAAVKTKIDNATDFLVEGQDAQGKAATFDFIVLTNDYVWAKGSTTQITANGKLVSEADAPGKVLSPKLRESLANASALIGVGVASKGGKRADEEARALARAKTVAGWIAKAKPETPVFSLTLGQVQKNCKVPDDKDLSFDRPVLLLGIRSKTEGVNLEEALANALAGQSNLPNRDCYSRFDIAQIR